MLFCFFPVQHWGTYFQNGTKSLLIAFETSAQPIILYVVMNQNIISQCNVCGKKLKGRQTRFCSASCKGKENNNKYQCYQSQKIRALQRKKELVQLLGGCCSKCGYSKNLAALCFHHKYDKKFKLDSRTLSNVKLDKLKAEAEKCTLLCHNCHMEEHYPDYGGASRI